MERRVYAGSRTGSDFIASLTTLSISEKKPSVSVGWTTELAYVWGYGFILPAGDAGSFLLDQLRFLD
jgi:hypothetical protein